MNQFKNQFSPILALSAGVFLILFTTCKKEPAPEPAPNKPDLIVTDIKITTWDSMSIYYTYTIQNIGNWRVNLDGLTGKEEDNVKVQAFVSPDSAYEAGKETPAGGSILGLSPLGYLRQGESFNGNFYVNGLDMKKAVELPFFILYVDWANTVEEEKEENNVRIIRFR